MPGRHAWGVRGGPAFIGGRSMKTIAVLSVFAALLYGCAGSSEAPDPDEAIPTPNAPTDTSKQRKFATADAAARRLTLTGFNMDRNFDKGKEPQVSLDL